MQFPTHSIAQPEALSRPDAPQGAPDAHGVPGLVIFKTSDTALLESIEIDLIEARMKRLRRSITWAARLFEHCLGKRQYKPAMLTLTYRDVDGFRPRHISELIKRIRQWASRRGHVLRYVWVAELQRRGALHYHVLLWLPRGLSLSACQRGWPG